MLMDIHKYEYSGSFAVVIKLSITFNTQLIFSERHEACKKQGIS